MTNEKNESSLFSTIDLSANNFLESAEAAQLFQTPAGTDLFNMPPANPFEGIAQTTPIVETKKVEPPVVEVKKEGTAKNKKPTKGKGKKQSELAKKIKEQKTKRENMKVDTTWNIAYAAQQYNPPEDDMTLEQVREYLEIDFPELSKERCRMEIDSAKKLIVPIVSGAKKG